MFLVIDKGKLYVTSAPARDLRSVEHYEEIEYVPTAELRSAQRATQHHAAARVSSKQILRIEPRVSAGNPHASLINRALALLKEHSS